MRTVTLQQLKTCLRKYIRQVRVGESVLITDRGEVVAELIPPRQGNKAIPPGLIALARQGKVTLGRPNDPRAYPKLPPLLKRYTSAELLDEDRGS